MGIREFRKVFIRAAVVVEVYILKEEVVYAWFGFFFCFSHYSPPILSTAQDQRRTEHDVVLYRIHFH